MSQIPDCNGNENSKHPPRPMMLVKEEKRSFDNDIYHYTCSLCGKEKYLQTDKNDKVQILSEYPSESSILPFVIFVIVVIIIIYNLSENSPHSQKITLNTPQVRVPFHDKSEQEESEIRNQQFAAQREEKQILINQAEEKSRMQIQQMVEKSRIQTQQMVEESRIQTQQMVEESRIQTQQMVEEIQGQYPQQSAYSQVIVEEHSSGISGQ